MTIMSGEASAVQPASFVWSSATRFSSSRVRRINSGNCCNAIIWRLVCLSGQGGDAEHDALVGNVAHDAGLRADHRLVSQLQVAGDPRLRGDYAIILPAACCLRIHLAHHQAVAPDDHVVRDMDEIINLRALADDGGSERAAVNRPCSHRSPRRRE